MDGLNGREGERGKKARKLHLSNEPQVSHDTSAHTKYECLFSVLQLVGPNLISHLY